MRINRLKTCLLTMLLMFAVFFMYRSEVFAAVPSANIYVNQAIPDTWFTIDNPPDTDTSHYNATISAVGTRNFTFREQGGTVQFKIDGAPFTSTGSILVLYVDPNNQTIPRAVVYILNIIEAPEGEDPGAGTVNPDSDTRNGTANSGAAAAKPMDPAEAARLYAWIASGYNNDLLNPPANTHNHSYEWVETRAATEDENGEYVYKCNCGSVLYRVPTNAMGVFVKNTIEKIQRAGNGATVEINTKRWYSFPKSVFDALAARPDVSLTVNYLSEGYKGDPMTFTIPAGTDVSTIPDENGYAGFTFLGGIFGATPR